MAPHLRWNVPRPAVSHDHCAHSARRRGERAGLGDAGHRALGERDLLDLSGPEQLEELRHGQLDRARSVLEDAAVIGMNGPIVLVETLANTHGIDARTALTKLSAAGLLDVGDDEYAFRNELTREIAYGTLTKAERARRHGVLAKTIAMDGERTGRIEEVMDRLAYHFNLAASLMAELGSIDGLPNGMIPAGVRFLARAAERATGFSAPSNASNGYLC